MGGGGGLLSSITGGMPVKVMNFPPGMGTLNSNALGTSIGGALAAGGIGIAIGAPIASAITVWGRMEVERSEARLDKILGLLASDDPKKRKMGMRFGGERLKEIEGWSGGQIIGSVIQGAFGGPGGATAAGAGEVSGPAKWLGSLLDRAADPLYGQREFEKASIQQGIDRAEDAERTSQAIAQLGGSAEDTLGAFAKFKSELERFKAPSPGDKPNRGDAPSPVKP